MKKARASDSCYAANILLKMAEGFGLKANLAKAPLSIFPYCIRKVL
jgi:hypothetical protein